MGKVCIESKSNFINSRINSEKVHVLKKLWERALQNPNKVHYDLKGYLKDINLWIMAHKKIVQDNKFGYYKHIYRRLVLTRAEKDNILYIQKQVLEGSYIFSKSPSLSLKQRRERGRDPKKYIPFSKKNNNFDYGKFPIWKPSYSDNLVETVLFLILEPIYAVGFDKNSSFAYKFNSFDTKRSVHSALKHISTKYF